MSGPVPALGFSSRTDAVVALRSEGLSTPAIAAKIGITTKQVNSLEASARRVRRRGGRVGYADAGSEQAHEPFPHHLRELVRSHAARRDVTCTRLIQMIVDKVIGDDIVDAVLDDADEIGRH